MADNYSFNDVVNKMTNYERNQWAKAGYPGLKKEELDKLEPYSGAAIRRITGEFIVLSGRA